MLLFLTNFLAILLAGGVVFMLSGLGWLAAADSQTRMQRNAFALILVATLLVAIPLTLTAYQVVARATDNRRATDTTEQWLAGTPNHLVAINVRDRVVFVSVEGAGELRPLRDLADGLATALGRPVVVTLRAIPAESEASSGN